MTHEPPADNAPDARPAPAVLPQNDKSGRIKGMGVFQIVLGSLSGLMTLLLIPVTLLQNSMAGAMGHPQGTPSRRCSI